MSFFAHLFVVCVVLMVLAEILFFIFYRAKK